MENQQYVQEDEISFKDYVNIVIKRKKLILVIFSVSIIAAVVASLFMPKVYEMTTIVRLGSVDIAQLGIRNDMFLMKQEKAQEIILNKSFLLPIIEELKLKIEVKDLKKNIKVILIDETNLIKIKITYPGLDMLVKVNNAIIDSFITEGEKVRQKKVSVVNNWLKQYESEIAKVETDLDRTRSLISKLSDFNNNSQPKIPPAEIFSKTIQLQSILSGYEANLIKLREQRNNTEFMLDSFKPFDIFDAPVKPKKPIMPLELNVLIAGIISLLCGVFLASSMESWQKN